MRMLTELADDVKGSGAVDTSAFRTCYRSRVWTGVGDMGCHSGQVVNFFRKRMDMPHSQGWICQHGAHASLKMWSELVRFGPGSMNCVTLWNDSGIPSQILDRLRWHVRWSNSGLEPGGSLHLGIP
jgi:hypothetical protein